MTKRVFARGLSTASRLNHARARSAAIGHDIRTVRHAWGLNWRDFGVMMGSGLLSEVTVQRWELGLEKPPPFVETWVIGQRNGHAFRRRVWSAHRALGDERTRQGMAVLCLERLQGLGPVVCGRDYFARQRVRRRRVS